MCSLRCPEVRVVAHDKSPAACDPPGTTLRDAVTADLVFVSVPTPMLPASGRVDLSIVEAVVANIREVDPGARIVVRSTVPPGTCARLRVHFMPEFLTEAAAAEDFRRNPVWVLGAPGGAPDPAVRAALGAVFRAAKRHRRIESDRTEWVHSTEAELIKYFRNTFLATKVAFCNEFASLCATLGVEYGAVRKHAAVDARIGLSHTAVPGPDGMTGYGGTCFPKDTRGLIGVFDQHRVRCRLLEASVERNETIDRPGREWLSMVGRAVSERDEASTSDSV